MAQDYPTKRDRMAAALARIGKDFKWLRNKIGISSAVMSHAAAGRVTHDEAIAEHLGVPLTWLQSGSGPEPTWALRERVDQLKRAHPIATKLGLGILPQLELERREDEEGTTEQPPAWALAIMRELRSLHDKVDQIAARQGAHQDVMVEKLEDDIIELSDETEVSHGR